MYSIIDFYKSTYELTEQEIELLKKMIVLKKVSKGEFLQRKGEKLTKFYFVKSGLLRAYSIDSNGKEHIFMFAPEGWLVADNSIDFNHCDLFIDAIEDSEIEVCSIDFMNNIIGVNREFGVNSNKKLVNRVRVLQKRIIMLMSATAWERYQDFIETYPNIVQRVSQKMIASYLGITPEALSKLRGTKHK